MPYSNLLHTPLIDAMHLQMDHFIYSHINLTFKQPGWYLNFWTWFVKKWLLFEEKEIKLWNKQ